jgi:hypothetical protein
LKGVIMPERQVGDNCAIPSERVDVPTVNKHLPFIKFVWKVLSLHMTTYFVIGAVASFVFNYKALWNCPELSCLMRPLDSPWVAAGSSLQFARGLLFAAVLYPIIGFFQNHRRGGPLLWSLFMGLSILGQAGPSPGSLEGVIYSKLPLAGHLTTMPEVFIQTLLFSTGLVAWRRRPLRWMSIATAIGVGLALCTSMLGFIEAVGR